MLGQGKRLERSIVQAIRRTFTGCLSCVETRLEPAARCPNNMQREQAQSHEEPTTKALG